MRSVMVRINLFGGVVTITNVNSSPSVPSVHRSYNTAMPMGLPSLGVMTCCSVLVGVISLPSLKVLTTERPSAGF